MNREKNSFLIYHDYRDHFELLSDEELGQFMRALMAYEIDGEIPKFDGMLKMAFSFVKSNLDRASGNYAEKCDKNKRNAKKRWDSKNANACERINRNANDADIDKDKEKVTDKDMDNFNVKETYMDDADNECPIGVDFAKIERQCGTLSSNAQAELKDFADKLPADVIMRAVDDMTDYNVHNWAYLRQILNNLVVAEVKTIDDYEREQAQFRAAQARKFGTQARGAPNKGKFHNFSERTESDEDFENALFDKLFEDEQPPKEAV